MKNASMLKFSILPPISDEILPWLCSNGPILGLVKMVTDVKNEAIFRRICIESLEHNCGNIADNLHQHADFWQRYLFSLDLSGDLNKSHKFINFKFCDVTLYHYIKTVHHKNRKGGMRNVGSRDHGHCKVYFVRRRRRVTGQDGNCIA